jgi:hypothetical protein
MLPCFGLAILAIGAAWILRVYIADVWYPIARLVATGVTIGLIMISGWFLIYGRTGFTKLIYSPDAGKLVQKFARRPGDLLSAKRARKRLMTRVWYLPPSNASIGPCGPAVLNLSGQNSIADPDTQTPPNAPVIVPIRLTVSPITVVGLNINRGRFDIYGTGGVVVRTRCKRAP